MAEFELYTPAEVENITGINSATIRKWRERGRLPANEATDKGAKHSRFAAHEIVALLALDNLDHRKADDGAIQIAVETARQIAAAHMWQRARREGTAPTVTDPSADGCRYVAVSGLFASATSKLQGWPFPVRDIAGDGSFTFNCFDVIAAAEMVSAQAPRPVVKLG